jgi:hypothetical protein
VRERERERERESLRDVSEGERGRREWEFEKRTERESEIIQKNILEYFYNEKTKKKIK